VLYTDGLSEARNEAGEEWGPERLQGEIERNGALKGCDLLPSVVAAAGRFAGRDLFEDDVCIVFLGARP
jgi:serine phosphatase RsbU (regulator of sigma subunit)